jgi:hypothetical protein
MSEILKTVTETTPEIVDNATPEGGESITAEPVAEGGEPLIYLAEHTIYTQPNVTEVAYFKGSELFRAKSVNPCPLLPGIGYTISQIEGVLHGAS